MKSERDAGTAGLRGTAATGRAISYNRGSPRFPQDATCDRPEPLPPQSCNPATTLSPPAFIRSVRRCLFSLTPLCLILIAGCCTGQPPRNRAEALARVNNNLDLVNAPVYCKSWVSFRFRDADGKTHRYLQDARLIYERPRFLRFDVLQSLIGTVAQFGSDGQRYWLWIEPEVNKLWFGSWDLLADSRKLAIPPDDLLDALMLRPLPEQIGDGNPCQLDKRGFHYWLVYHTSTGTREIKLDCNEPYQPREIVDRNTAGDVVMHAELSRYHRIGDGPYTPRKYVVNWPLDDTELRMDVLTARLRPELPEDVFAFPQQWSGARERIDATAPASSPEPPSRSNSPS